MDRPIELLYQSSVPRECYGLYLAAWMAATTRHPIGTNIYERSNEWDIAVILDACRVDALEEVKSEFDFIENVSSIKSVGTTSKEWMMKTFTEGHRDKVESTHLVTANPFTRDLETQPINYLDFPEIKEAAVQHIPYTGNIMNDKSLTMKHFAQYDPIYKYRRNIHDFGSVVLPEDVTDRTIAAYRDGAERIVAHYMQPHDPYIASARHRSNGENKELLQNEKHPFDSLRAGKVTRNEVWEAYIENLREVLKSVELLLSNVEGQVLITADHGELFGEWGLYSHAPGIWQTDLWNVPWVTVSGADRGTYSPSIEYKDETMDENDFRENLKTLGYI